MGKVLAQFSLAMLAAAGSIVLLSRPIASVVGAVDMVPAGEATVVDRNGYYIVTIGRVQVILTADASSG
jgi:hypothetical protein